MVDAARNSGDGINASEFLEYYNFMRSGGRSDKAWNLVNDTYQRLEKRGIIKSEKLKDRNTVYFINER